MMDPPRGDRQVLVSQAFESAPTDRIILETFVEHSLCAFRDSFQDSASDSINKRTTEAFRQLETILRF